MLVSKCWAVIMYNQLRLAGSSIEAQVRVVKSRDFVWYIVKREPGRATTALFIRILGVVVKIHWTLCSVCHPSVDNQRSNCLKKRPVSHQILLLPMDQRGPAYVPRPAYGCSLKTAVEC